MLRDRGVQPPCQLFTVNFFLGLQILICFFSHVVCHVILYCFTHDIEGPSNAMCMPSTTNSRILEMAIVCQPLICCISFRGQLPMLQDKLKSLLFISAYSFIWWNEIGPTNISRNLFAVEPDQRKSNLSLTDHSVLVLNRKFL